MKIAGLSLSSPWAADILTTRGVEASRVSDVEAEITAHVEYADLGYHGPGLNHRPYLHLSGELRAARPLAAALPHEVDGVVFAPGVGDRVDAYYEFDDTQLTALAAKGYFRSGFAVPDDLTDIDWVLPARIDALVVAPDPDNPVPVTFIRVHDISDLHLDLENSGYDLAEYFHDAPQAQAQDSRGVVDTLEADAADLVATVSAPRPETAPQVVQDEEESGLGDPEVARRLAEIAADLDAGRVPGQDEADAAQDGPANIDGNDGGSDGGTESEQAPVRRSVPRRAASPVTDPDLELDDPDTGDIEPEF